LLLDVILNKMKFFLKALITTVIFFLFLFFPKPSFAEVTYEKCEVGAEIFGGLNESEATECVNLLTDLLNETKGSISSLKSEIKKYNLTIAIANAKILKSVKEIEALEEGIEGLDNKIFKLDLSLDQLSELLIERISETYKKGRINAFSLFLSSDSFSNFVSRYKYLRVIQLNDRALMFQLETARSNFKDQKTIKEEKQEELETVKNKLKAQQATLSKYKKDKENFLAITENDEKKYQQLLAQANKQLDRFRVFTTSQGGASILFGQTKCDPSWGCYYNQRDDLWGEMFLGGTTYLMRESGCFITSVAMLASHSGRNIKPDDIARLPAVITSNGDLKWDFWVNGINVSISSPSKGELDQKLNEGKPVIAGLHPGNAHFIVIKGKNGDDYIIHDPSLENGHNYLFSKKYSISDINSLRIISFN